MRTILQLLAVLALVPLVAADPPLSPIAIEPASKQSEAIRKIQALLDEQLVESKHFQQEIPLAKFLDALEKQLPKDKKVSLRIDNDVFGDKLAEVGTTPMRLPPVPRKMSLRTVLHLAVAQINAKADYHIGTAEIAITTPERALYTAVYDIRDLVEKPQAFVDRGPNFFRESRRLRNAEPATRAALVVQALLSAMAPGHGVPTAAKDETIEVLNGTRLAIHASAARHAQATDMLSALRHFGDVLVIVHAKLYEVDRPFYTKVASAKRLTQIDLEEVERQFLNSIPPLPRPGGDTVPPVTRSTTLPPVARIGDPVSKLLEKQPMILAGERIKIDDGREAAVLSWHRAVSYGASPDQVRRGEAGQQSVLEGVSFLAGVRVTSDRRFVRLQFTEKAAELQGINKVKVWDAAEKELDAVDFPFLDENVYSRLLIVPDGGSELLPVHYRPRSAKAKDRWWVVSITPRIWIEEEERWIRNDTLAEVLPALATDILTNPRLKATREFYGTAGDKRFALVDRDAHAWPKGLQLDIPGYQLTTATRAGKRLLGIRLDNQAWVGNEGGNLTIMVTLVNAGGSANGAVIGGCTVRYSACWKGKAWVVELAEAAD